MTHSEVCHYLLATSQTVLVVSQVITRDNYIGTHHMHMPYTSSTGEATVATHAWTKLYIYIMSWVLTFMYEREALQPQL